MKKVLYLASFVALLTGRLAQAQITPETTYQGHGPMIRMSTGDYKYQMYRSSTNQVILYNLNHSVYKQFTVPIAATGYTSGYDRIAYVSDALFDNNPATVEFIAQYGYANNISGVYREIVYSETGSQLAVLDSVSSLAVYNTPSGTKMVAVKAAYNPTNGNLLRDYTRVYALPGQLALRVATPTVAEISGAYPNPATGLVNLPYVVKAGETGTLRVYDISGKLSASYKVDAHINRLELSIRDLRAGVYIYRIETASGVTAGQRFVIE